MSSSFKNAGTESTDEEAVEKAYADGRKLAIKEGKLAKFGVRMPEETEYPLVCPFSVKQIIDEDFYGWRIEL